MSRGLLYVFVRDNSANSSDGTRTSRWKVSRRGKSVEVPNGQFERELEELTDRRTDNSRSWLLCRTSSLTAGFDMFIFGGS